MANPDAFETEGFLFPMDDAAVNSLREHAIDERTFLEIIDVPPLMQIVIRGRHMRVALREAGVADWPKGELQGERLQLFLDCLKAMRGEKSFFKDQVDLSNKIISQFERAVVANRSVWLNF